MYREAMKDLRRLVSLDSSNAGGCYIHTFPPGTFSLSEGGWRLLTYRLYCASMEIRDLDGARGPEL